MPDGKLKVFFSSLKEETDIIPNLSSKAEPNQDFVHELNEVLIFIPCLAIEFTNRWHYNEASPSFL